jgi:hypothetical protein
MEMGQDARDQLRLVFGLLGGILGIVRLSNVNKGGSAYVLSHFTLS